MFHCRNDNKMMPGKLLGASQSCEHWKPVEMMGTFPTKALIHCSRLYTIRLDLMNPHCQHLAQWCQQGRCARVCVRCAHIFTLRRQTTCLRSCSVPAISFMRSSILTWGYPGGTGGLHWVIPGSCCLVQKKKIEAHTNSELARVLFRSKRNTQNRYTAEREQWGPIKIALGYFVKLPLVGPGGQEEGVSSWGWGVGDFVSPLMGLGYVTLFTQHVLSHDASNILIICMPNHA